jgi:hypothetical protein
VAFALVGMLLEGAAIVERGEFGRLLGLMASITGEASAGPGEILSLWAAMASEASHRD